VKEKKQLKGKGLGVATAHSFEDEPSSMVHEQLARLKFAETIIDMKNKRILDFGCGTGYNSYFIAKRQSPKIVVGIDILEECISYCKDNYSAKNTAFHVQDCLVHNPELVIFDVVISCEVIEHVADQKLFLDVLAKYLRPGGIAFISTPNRALFSLSKEKSFLNPTHIRELFFKEFSRLLNECFSEYTIYSQIHTSGWHNPYINYLTASNLVYALRYEVFGDNLIGKLVSKIGKHLLFTPLFIIKSRDYPDVRKRRYYDFKFIEGFDPCACWFVAKCTKKS